MADYRTEKEKVFNSSVVSVNKKSKFISISAYAVYKQKEINLAYNELHQEIR